MTSTVAREVEAYQAYLEGHRRNPDNEDLYADLQKARIAMEVAWLKYILRGNSTSPS